MNPDQAFFLARRLAVERSISGDTLEEQLNGLAKAMQAGWVVEYFSSEEPFENDYRHVQLYQNFGKAYAQAVEVFCSENILKMAKIYCPEGKLISTLKRSELA